MGILNFDFSHDSDFKLFAATLIVELNIVADNINREHYCDDILNLDDEKIDFFYERAIKTYIKLVKNDDISFDNDRKKINFEVNGLSFNIELPDLENAFDLVNSILILTPYSQKDIMLSFNNKENSFLDYYNKEYDSSLSMYNFFRYAALLNKDRGNLIFYR